MKTLAIAILAAFSLGAASQYAYTKRLKFNAPITQAEAAQGMTWFKARGVWNETPVSGVQHCCIVRHAVDETYPDGLMAECNGWETGTVSADMLPEGAKVTEVHN